MRPTTLSTDKVSNKKQHWLMPPPQSNLCNQISLIRKTVGDKISYSKPAKSSSVLIQGVAQPASLPEKIVKKIA